MTGTEKQIADFSLPRIDWSKWDQLSRKDQREIAARFADVLADAPLDIQCAVLIAVSKRSREKKKKPRAKPPQISADQQAIIDEHERENGPVDAPQKLAAFRDRYGRPLRDDWQETRKALLIAAVDEVVALRGRGLPNRLAREVVSARYRGLALGVGRKAMAVKLRVSATVLYHVENSGAHLAGGSPEALHMDLYLCGRPKRQQSLS
jgi:hypothetical protein